MQGNDAHPLTEPFLAHSFTAPVHRGRNLVVLRLVGSTGYGCRINMETAVTDADFSPSTLQMSSLYRGPLLLAYDMALNDGADCLRWGLDNNAPQIDADRTERTWLAPQLLLRMRSSDGQNARLCDFASAGLSGSHYRTWLPIRSAAPSAKFSRTNPLRTVRMRPGRECELTL